MSWPWETRTSTCRNFATISSGLYRFLAIAVLLDVETYLKSDHFVGGESLGYRDLTGRRPDYVEIYGLPCATSTSPRPIKPTAVSRSFPTLCASSRYRRNA